MAQDGLDRAGEDDDHIVVTGQRGQVLTSASPTGSRLGITVAEADA